MIGLSFASVPLYDLFCRVTGFGGTTQIAENAPDKILNKVIKVRFDTNVSSNLAFNFRFPKSYFEHVTWNMYLVKKLLNFGRTWSCLACVTLPTIYPAVKD